MRDKRLKSGAIAYFWEAPSIYRKQGFQAAASEPLGADFGSACERSNFLNAHLDAWREGKGAVKLAEVSDRFGTVSWLFKEYRNSRAFMTKVSERSRYEYVRAVERIENLATREGAPVSRVGDLPLASITAAAVDKIYGRLQSGPRGKRVRQANLSIDIARRAWKVVYRLHPTIVPEFNPWIGVDRDSARNTKPAATRLEAYALAFALKELGEPHLGAAALICFEWHQRPEHVRGGDITWADYRPPQRPDAVQIRHPKTGEKGWVPLDYTENGKTVLLYPEIEAYLASLQKLGLPIVLTSGDRGACRPYSSEFAQRRVREARQLAKLGAHVTLDACRHGGLTELGDAGVTEFEGMSASMHKSPTALRLYVKRSETQRTAAAIKRRLTVDKT